MVMINSVTTEPRSTPVSMPIHVALSGSIAARAIARRQALHGSSFEAVAKYRHREVIEELGNSTDTMGLVERN